MNEQKRVTRKQFDLASVEVLRIMQSAEKGVFAGVDGEGSARATVRAIARRWGVTIADLPDGEEPTSLYRLSRTLAGQDGGGR